MPNKLQPDAETLRKLEEVENSWLTVKPPKPDDENDRAVKQKEGYRPESSLVRHRLASDAGRVAKARLAARRPGAAVVFPYGGWRKIHREMPPPLRGSWLLLPWLAQLIYLGLCLHCDDDGVVELGQPGLRAVCGLLHAPHPDDWKQIEPLLQELIERRWLVWEAEEPHRATVAWFRESQNTAPSDEATRKARYRATSGTRPGQSRDIDPRDDRDKTGTRPGQSRDSPAAVYSGRNRLPDEGGKAHSSGSTDDPSPFPPSLEAAPLSRTPARSTQQRPARGGRAHRDPQQE